MNIQELLHELDVVEDDYFRGVYTAGEIYDLTRAITQVLKDKHFIR